MQPLFADWEIFVLQAKTIAGEVGFCCRYTFRMNNCREILLYLTLEGLHALDIFSRQVINKWLLVAISLHFPRFWFYLFWLSFSSSWTCISTHQSSHHSYRCRLKIFSDLCIWPRMWKSLQCIACPLDHELADMHSWLRNLEFSVLTYIVWDFAFPKSPWLRSHLL